MRNEATHRECECWTKCHFEAVARELQRGCRIDMRHEIELDCICSLPPHFVTSFSFQFFLKINFDCLKRKEKKNCAKVYFVPRDFPRLSDLIKGRLMKLLRTFISWLKQTNLSHEISETVGFNQGRTHEFIVIHINFDLSKMNLCHEIYRDGRN
jgi:hypothetical protein